MGYQVGERDGSRRALWAAALLATTAAAWTAPAFAQADAQRNFDVPAQPLPSALTQFGRQSGLQVSVPAALADGRTSSAVSGSLAPIEALSRLLAGTGLTYRISGNIVTLEPAPQASGSTINLGPVRVEGSGTGSAAASAPPQAIIGNPPPVYAGAQVATGGQVGMLGNRSVMDTPYTVTNYTSELMSNQQARSISDVLNNDSSVRSTLTQGGYADEFFIRGFQVLNTDISLDGLYGILPGQLVSTDFAERVEVLRGPSALINGISPSGAVGGAINIVPKRATDAPISDVDLRYTSDAQIGAHVDLGRRFGSENQWGIRLNVSDSGGDTPLDHQSQQLQNAFIGLDFRGTQLRISLDAGYQHYHSNGFTQAFYVNPGFDIPRPPSFPSNFMPPWSYTTSEDYFGALRAEYDVSPNWTVFAAVGGRANNNRQLQTQAVFLNSAGDVDLGPDFFANRTDNVTGQVGLRGSFETGPIKHQLSLSANTYWQETGYSLFFPSGSFLSNIYHPASFSPPDGEGYPWTTPKGGTSTASSLAVADTLSSLNDVVQLTVGLREQWVGSKNYDTTITTTGDLLSKYDSHKLSPSVALVVKPLHNVSLYANYTEGLQVGSQAPTTAVNAGEIFPPFISKQYEVGAKVDWGKFTTTISAFQIKQPSGFTDPTTLIYGVYGLQRNRGIELNAFGEIVKGVRLLGGISLVDGKLTQTDTPSEDGNKAVGVPDVQINAGGEWDVPWLQGLTLTGRAIYTSSQYVDVANTQKIPDWTRFDLGARYSLQQVTGKPITLRAEVRNVANKNYWSAASAFYGLAQGLPRTFLISASFQF